MPPRASLVGSVAVLAPNFTARPHRVEAGRVIALSLRALHEVAPACPPAKAPWVRTICGLLGHRQLPDVRGRVAPLVLAGARAETADADKSRR
jgi:hypothetical protein